MAVSDPSTLLRISMNQSPNSRIPQNLFVMILLFEISKSQERKCHKCQEFGESAIIDGLPSKSQMLCEFCAHVNQLKHC